MIFAHSAQKGGIRHVNSSLGMIYMLDNLMKRRLSFVNWCCLCQSNGETLDHLLMKCELVKLLLLYGGVYFRFLVITGSCQGLFGVYCFVREISLGNMAQMFRIWC